MTTSTAASDHRTFRPTGAAARAIRSFVAYRTPADPARRHRGLPSPLMTMVFSLADPFPITSWEGGSLRESAYRTVVSGLGTTPVVLPLRQDCAGVQLAVHPFAARAVFGMPAGELADRNIELADLGDLGDRGNRGNGRLGQGRLVGPAQVAELCDVTGGRWTAEAVARSIHDWIGRQMTDARFPAPEVRQAWRLIVGSAGRRRIGEVAAEVGWSRRHLTAQLRIETGLGAKDLARVARFEQAVRMLKSARRPGLSEVAAECGFTDQAHLANDWRSLARCSATEWLATDRPS